MHSHTNKTGPEQKRIRDEHLAELAASKHKRCADMARKIGLVAAKQIIFNVGETPEDYLVRIGFDLTKI